MIATEYQHPALYFSRQHGHIFLSLTSYSTTPKRIVERQFCLTSLYQWSCSDHASSRYASVMTE